MAKIIFDIETVGEDLGGFDQATQEYFLKFAKTDEEVALARDSTSFYPVTAKIVTIAMLEAETDKACVVYLVPGRALERITEGDAEFISAGTEKQLLELFWQRLEKVEQVITFNGRGFDAPFIMTRSAVHHVRCAKNLMPDRYRSVYHLDLMEKLTFLGATRRRFGLHMWCNAFGIKSPKEEGVTGLDVKDLYAAGRYLDIAHYCLRDVGATKELYLAWDKYMNVPGA